MKKRSWAILFVLSFLAGVMLWRSLAHEPVYDNWCTLKSQASDSPSESALVTLASQALMPLASAPNDISDLPETFKEPHFYKMTVGTTTRSLVIDLSDTPQLCLDTNGDRNLSDEQPFSVKSVKIAGQKRDRFGPIGLTSKQTDSQAAGFYLTIYSRQKAGLAWLYPTHLRQGKLRIGKQILKVAVADGNYDGQFNSIVSLPVHGLIDLPYSDVLAIDYNGNGQFERNDYGHSEVMPLGRMIYLWHKYYAVNITPDGSKLELKPIEPEMGKLAIDIPDVRGELRLWSDAADQYTPFTSGEKDLPAGKYQTLQVVLRMNDKNNHEWTFAANNKLGDLNFFEIRPGETTHLKPGPPFIVTASIEQRNNIVYITPAIRGRAGEAYRLDFRRNGRRPPKRAFRIVTEDGIVLVDDTFEYG